MSEESITGLMHGLIVVLCKEAKKQNIVLRQEGKKQNIEEDVINYIDKVLEEYEEEKTSDVDETKSEVFSNEDVPKLNEKESIPTVQESKDVQEEEKVESEVDSPSSGEETDEMTGLTDNDESDIEGKEEVRPMPPLTNREIPESENKAWCWWG